MESKQTISGHPMSSHVDERLQNRLGFLYPRLEPEQLGLLSERISETLDSFRGHDSDREFRPDSSELWSEKDTVLITYADQVSDEDNPTLVTLRKFLEVNSTAELINIVHLLPFYTFSSDDGFSVIDYLEIAPGMGDWKDLEALGQAVDLMFDLVLNHCSQHNLWFRKFQSGDPDYENYFHVVPEGTDLSQVTRPRSLPLLTRFSTRTGEKLIWTTFSDDQVDLNFAEPAVFLEFLKILLFYIQRGARIIRLDAVAFLWKTIGTRCIHLPETHEVIKLFRDLLTEVAPHVILLTETNVPHEENVSYFGKGDEAHMVYQFSLPPLIIDTMIHQDATPLRQWLGSLSPPPEGTTFFNFAASHDGIGVRPLEGLLEPERFESLIATIRQRGGQVSTRRQPDGSDTPYELNISYFDAVVGNEDLKPEVQVRKFLSSQTVILALPGIPGIYFHSLVGTPNDLRSAQLSGIPRRINRRKYQFDELQALLKDTSGVQAMIFAGYQELVKIRTSNRAFHPAGSCQVWGPDALAEMGSTRLLVFERTSPDGAEKILVIVNPTDNAMDLKLPSGRVYRDLRSEASELANHVPVESFGFRWLAQTSPSS